jgi:hypothetical protein
MSDRGRFRLAVSDADLFSFPINVVEGMADSFSSHDTIDIPSQSHVIVPPPSADSSGPTVSLAFDLSSSLSDQHARLEPPGVSDNMASSNGMELGEESLVSEERPAGVVDPIRAEKAYPSDDLVMMGFLSEIEAGSLFLR